jgi:type IV pilus assembly protein PilX
MKPSIRPPIRHRQPAIALGLAFKQRGVALVITLIVLVIVTLLSLSSIRTTTLQERMSANVLDRELTFQTAESILRLAEIAVADNPNFAAHGGVDCSAAAVACLADPLDPNFTGWQPLPASAAANVPNQAFAPGTGQYHVAFLGIAPEANEASLGQEQSANNIQYGADQSGGAPVSHVFRISVRNQDPTATGARSFVMLQSTIRVRQ